VHEAEFQPCLQSICFAISKMLFLVNLVGARLVIFCIQNYFTGDEFSLLSLQLSLGQLGRDNTDTHSIRSSHKIQALIHQMKKAACLGCGNV
jgi:hypothetical protein